MLILLSPAKSLDWETGADVDVTVPVLMEQTEPLVQRLTSMSISDLKKLLDVSDALARLNYERYQTWRQQDTKACAFAFDGPAYKELNFATFTPSERFFAQQHLRILSGLYGLLQPLDGIRPYRLDMGKKLKMDSTSDLYAYWSTQVTQELNRQVKDQPSGQQFLVNCASQEYFKVVDQSQLQVPVYHMCFPGPAIYAKQARGSMARYIIQQQILDVEGLKGFTGKQGEWRFDPKQSKDHEFVFVRSSAGGKGNATRAKTDSKTGRASSKKSDSTAVAAAAPGVEDTGVKQTCERGSRSRKRTADVENVQETLGKRVQHEVSERRTRQARTK